MAKFTVVNNSTDKSGSNVVPIKVLHSKTLKKHRSYLTIICVVEFLIILGMLVYGRPI